MQGTFRIIGLRGTEQCKQYIVVIRRIDKVFFFQAGRPLGMMKSTAVNEYKTDQREIGQRRERDTVDTKCFLIGQFRFFAISHVQ